MYLVLQENDAFPLKHCNLWQELPVAKTDTIPAGFAGLAAVEKQIFRDKRISNRYMAYRIAVLFHENDTEHTIKSSLIYYLQQYWEEDGHEVLFLFGTKKHVPADLIFVHVDLSVVPDKYLEFAEQYPVAVNGKVRDIRKSTIGANNLGHKDSWQGAVIVKTNNNCAGLPEKIRNGLVGRVQRKMYRAIKKTSLNKFLMAPQSPTDYRIYDSLKDVPFYFFLHPNLVIQKFTPEIEDDLYCIRHMIFLGDRTICFRLKGKSPILNGDNSEHIEHNITPHPDILSLRKKMNFDYGKFDFVEVNGQAILFDANKTIGYSNQLGDDEKVVELRRFRAEGIYSFLS